MRVPPNHRVEIQSYSTDPSMQFVGSDPYGGTVSLGMKVPTLATNSLPSAVPAGIGLQNRYLFLLASFQVPESGGCARIIGYRLLVELWAQQTGGSGTRFVRQTVTNPEFTLADANWCWHLRYTPTFNIESFYAGTGNVPVTRADATTTYLDGAAYRMASTPSILYDFMEVPAADPQYVDLIDYVPPNQGRPWGEPVANLGTIYGLPTPYNSAQAWFNSLDIPCRDPGIYALYASVRQTNTSTRLALTPPGTFYGGGLSAEEQFLLNFPLAYIGAIGGSLIVEGVDDCDTSKGPGACYGG
jgi:hypothetical protein